MGLAVAESTKAGEPIASADALRVFVFDRVRRPQAVDTIAEKIHALLRGVRLRTGSAADVKVEACPLCESCNDSIVLSLGVLIQHVARRCGVAEMDGGSVTFVRDVRRALCAVFTALRVEADEVGDREVFNLLASEAQRKAILTKLCTRPAAIERVVGASSAAIASRGPTEGDVDEVKALRVLTWNISQTSVNLISFQAPQNDKVWSADDNMAAVRAEVFTPILANLH